MSRGNSSLRICAECPGQAQVCWMDSGNKKWYCEACWDSFEQLEEEEDVRGTGAKKKGAITGGGASQLANRLENDDSPPVAGGGGGGGRRGTKKGGAAGSVSNRKATEILETYKKAAENKDKAATEEKRDPVITTTTTVAGGGAPASVTSPDSPFAALGDRRGRVFMVSGHIDITPEEFASHYGEALQRAVNWGQQNENNDDKEKTTDAEGNQDKKETQDYLSPSLSCIVVGDADGVDCMAQEYLLAAGVDASRVAVFARRGKHSPRNCLHKQFKLFSDFSGHTAKDEAMTLCSDEDIAWVRSDEAQKALYGDKYRPRVSGTEKNLIRRRSLPTM